MPIKRRIYVSLPADRWLSSQMNELKWGVVDEVEKLGFVPEVFTNPRGKPGLASPRVWSPREAEEIARHCMGAVVIGMPRWRFTDPEDGHEPVLLPTEFNHYEGALARTLGLPTLVLVQSNLRRRVVLDSNFGGYVGEFGPDAGLEWLHTADFSVPFGYWRNQLSERRDVFLGYSSKSEETALAIKRFLMNLGVSVLDWKVDLIPGRTILEQIGDAAARCTGGIFLFTKDDDLKASDIGKKKKVEQAVPRDNVVFEAGYFIGLKGKRRVLIIRETGSKMPADLGGDIYASLADRANIAPVERTLEAFVSAF